MSDDRVVLITGASRGIGRGLAEFFVERGCRVVGCSRSEAAPLEGYEHTRLDVTDEKALRGWLAAVRERHGRLDVVINNAGIGLAAFAAMTPSDKAEEIWRTNFHATFLVSREAAKVMMRQKSGRIVNMSSVAVPLQMEGSSVYSAAKAAVVQFTQVLAREMAPAGITCNVVAPSLVETDMMAGLTRDTVDKLQKALTIPRPLTTREVAHAVEFFARPESACITGQVLTLGLSG